MPKKTKRAPKLRTESELKEALWKYALLNTEDDELGFGQYNHTGEALRKEIDRFAIKQVVKVSGFVASKKDVGKIIAAVEESCLTEAAKKSLTAALTSATEAV